MGTEDGLPFTANRAPKAQQSHTKGTDTSMGKIIVVLLATLAALSLLAIFFGASRLSGTAFNVGTFNVSWWLVCGGVLGYGIYRIVKGK